MKSIAMIAALILLGTAARAETLIVPPYPATTPWKKVTDKRDDPRMVWIEWIPSDQTEADVRDILTEQIFYTQKGRDPSEFLRDLATRVGGACHGVSVNGPTAQTENGSSVAYVQVYCVGASGKDVDIFAKALAGHDALYVVQREFRRQAQPDAVPGTHVFPKGAKDEALAALRAQGEADQFLAKQVKLCTDDACASAPAPAGTAPPPNSANVNDLSNSFGFEAGKTTQEQVEDKLGRPYMQNHIPDGRHVDLYSFKNGSLIATFLFDKDNVLVRTTAFSHQ